MSSLDIQWDADQGGYLAPTNPQLLLEASGGPVKLTLDRDKGQKACGLIVAIYKGNEPFLKTPGDDECCGKSKYLTTNRLTMEADLAAGKYVVLCAQQKAQGKPIKFTLSTDNGKLSTMAFTGSKLSKTLYWRGEGAEGYGGSKNPQFFLKTTKPTRALITLTQKEENQDDPQGIIFDGRQVAKPNRRLLRFEPADDEEVFTFKSSFLASTSVSKDVNLPAAGNYNILVQQHKKGRPAQATLEVTLLDDGNGTLGGEEYSAPKPSVAKTFEKLLDEHKQPTSFSPNVDIEYLYDVDQAKRIVDQINASLGDNECFKDHSFGHNARSINATDQHKKLEPCDWTRPADICDAPCIFEGGATSDDIHQGSLGNCWFCSTIAAIASKQERVSRLFYPLKYNKKGAYAISIYVRGEWKAIIIDDYLPTRNGSLCFVRSGNPNELWLSFIEKAAAKVCTAYQLLMGRATPLGTNIVLEMLTGGEASGGSTSDNDFFDKCKEYMEKQWLVTTSTKDTADDKKGMVRFHAYTVIGALEVDGFQLLNVRNTWGRGEWTGDWSDNSDMWKKHPNIAKKCHMDDGANAKDDGAFWMSAKDFASNYGSLHYCKFVADEFPHEARIEGHFEPGAIAHEHANTFISGAQCVFNTDKGHTKVHIVCHMKGESGKHHCINLRVFEHGPLPLATPKKEAIFANTLQWAHHIAADLTLPGNDREFVVIPSASSLEEDINVKIEIFSTSKVSAKWAPKVSTASAAVHFSDASGTYKSAKAPAVSFKVSKRMQISAKIEFEGEAIGVLAAVEKGFNASTWPKVPVQETKYLSSKNLAIDGDFEPGEYTLRICQQKAIERGATVTFTSQGDLTVKTLQ